jgi:hypothetical protein
MAQSKKKVSKGNSGMMAAEIGAGIAAAAGAAAAAGYYFYASKDAAKNRRKTSKWATELKDKVVKEAKKQSKVVAKFDKQAMAVIVDKASKAYEGARNVKREDLMAAANELKQNWQIIQAELVSAAKKGGKVAKTVAKQSGSAVKKAAKTATKSATKAVAKKSAKKTAKKRA